MPSEFRSAFLILEKKFIPTTSTFNLRETLECGQVFRYQLVDGTYHLSAGEHHAVFKEVDGGWDMLATNAEFFQKYFDFDTKY